MRVFGWTRVEGPAGYGHPWPPQKRWVRVRDLPRRNEAGWEIPEGRCLSFMRAPGAISCGYPCGLAEGHYGEHVCDMSPHGVARWNDDKAALMNATRPSIAEMDDLDFWEPGEAKREC